MMGMPRPQVPTNHPSGRVPGTADSMQEGRLAPWTAPMPGSFGMPPGGLVSQQNPVIQAGLAGQEANLQGATPGGNPQDSILAHITPKEYAILSALAGGAKINPVSGLPAFWGAGDGSGAGVDGGAGVGDGGPGGPGGVDGGSPGFALASGGSNINWLALMSLLQGNPIQLGPQSFKSVDELNSFWGAGNTMPIAGLGSLPEINQAISSVKGFGIDIGQALGGGGLTKPVAPAPPQLTGLARGTGTLLNSQLQSTPAIQKILGQLGGVDFGFGQ